MKNNHYFYENLKNRLAIVEKFEKNKSSHKYLLPEIFLKTLKDTHRYLNNGFSALNSWQILDFLCINYTEEEKNILIDIENAVRKEKIYAQFVENYQSDILVSLIQKLQKFLSDRVE